MHLLDVDLVLDEGGVGRALLDRDEIVLAIDALLENAVQYTGAGGRIELRSRAHDGTVVIEVEDAGSESPRRSYRASSSASTASIGRATAAREAPASDSRSSMPSLARIEGASRFAALPA